MTIFHGTLSNGHVHRFEFFEGDSIYDNEDVVTTCGTFWRTVLGEYVRVTDIAVLTPAPS